MTLYDTYRRNKVKDLPPAGTTAFNRRGPLQRRMAGNGLDLLSNEELQKKENEEAQNITWGNWGKKAEDREVARKDDVLQTGQASNDKGTKTLSTLGTALGGNSQGAAGAGAAVAAGITTGVMEGSKSALPDGRRTVGHYTGKRAVQGAATGFQVGGVYGAIAGAVIGGVGGVLEGSKLKRRAEAAEKADIAARQADDLQRTGAAFANDPTRVYGRVGQGYYGKYGGQMKSPLTNMRMTGGYAKPLSKNNTELVGKSHDQGGIDIPEMNAEVEGDETTAGSYVFSEKLGYAKAHKPIAKAIGKIESKAPSDERINALKRLKEREQRLKESQEQVKQQLNLS